MTVAQATGTKIYIGTTASVAATDTYTEIGSAENIGALLVGFQEVTFNNMSAGQVERYKGARDDGTIPLVFGEDVADTGQIALKAAALATAAYNFKVQFNDAVAAESATVTISQADPGVVTMTGHGLAVGTAVSLATTGALPAGLTAATTYYIATVEDADTFTLAATAGGDGIETTDAGSGTHTLTTEPAASYALFKARVQSREKTVGDLSGNLMGNYTLLPVPATLAETSRIPLGS